MFGDPADGSRAVNRTEAGADPATGEGFFPCTMRTFAARLLSWAFLSGGFSLQLVVSTERHKLLPSLFSVRTSLELTLVKGELVTVGLTANFFAW